LSPALFSGFKEIRHGNRRDLRFLRSLFPDARDVDAAGVDDVLRAFANEMTSVLGTLDSRVRAPLLHWYPDLDVRAG
jgi:hypothetical protein